METWFLKRYLYGINQRKENEKIIYQMVLFSLYIILLSKWNKSIFLKGKKNSGGLEFISLELLGMGWLSADMIPLWKSHKSRVMMDSGRPEVCDGFELCLPYFCLALQLDHIITECKEQMKKSSSLYHHCNIQ